MGNGAIIENTEIAVDFWRSRKYPWIKHFFLSHMHADHTEGLTPSWRHKIYCSEISKKLLVHKIGVKECLVEPIEIGVPKTFKSENGGFIVTLMDANHCPGSVMFLFEGDFGRILYTADFRCDSKFLNWFLPMSIGHINLLYLDNTYFREDANFPTREETTKEIIRIISEHPRHQVLIVCYSIGKEELLVEIARTFGEWIIVGADKYSVLEILEMPNVFTKKVTAGRIRVIASKDLKKGEIQEWIKSVPTIAIFPTCMFNEGNNPYKTTSWEKPFFVPYSDHSSYQELKRFLSCVKAERVMPITKENASNCFKEGRKIKSNGCSSEGIFNFKALSENDHVYASDIFESVRKTHGILKKNPMNDCHSKLKKVVRNRPMLYPVHRSFARKGVVFDSDEETEKLPNKDFIVEKSVNDDSIIQDRCEPCSKTLDLTVKPPVKFFEQNNESDKIENILNKIEDKSSNADECEEKTVMKSQIYIDSCSDLESGEDEDGNETFENAIESPTLEEILKYIDQSSVFAKKKVSIANNHSDKNLETRLRILSNACSTVFEASNFKSLTKEDKALKL